LRLLTCLWAVWFGSVLTAPDLQSCPTHGEHAMHGAQMPAGAHHDAQHSHHGNKSSSGCTCLGACCCAPTVAPQLGAVAELPPTRITVDAARPLWSNDRAPAPAPRYAHPFANGPPVVLPA